MSANASSAAREPQLLPGAMGAWLGFVIGAGATGAALGVSSPGSGLTEILPVVLWALTAGGLAGGLVYLLSLGMASLLPPAPEKVFAAAQARYGMRMVRDDPGQAHERQTARWREQLGDRAALLALLAALVAGGWLLVFVLQVPGAGDPTEQETNAWLLFWGLGSAGLLLTLSVLVAALGAVWCRRVAPPAIETAPVPMASEAYSVDRPRTMTPIPPERTERSERPVPPSVPPSPPPHSGTSAPSKAGNDDYPDWPEND
jgi:hypothetical protein